MSTAMVGFAVVLHRGPMWAVAGAVCLLVAAVVIGQSLRRQSAPLFLLGLQGGTAWLFPLALLGIGLAVGAGVVHRGQPGVLSAGGDGGWHAFVLLAALIGAMEEVLYRGWVMGTLQSRGWPVAVVVAAVAHAAYKTALFVWPPTEVALSYDLGRIMLWTTVGGLVLGLLRLGSRSLWPAVAAHAAFDVVVYSAFAAPPWWVWG